MLCLQTLECHLKSRDPEEHGGEWGTVSCSYMVKLLRHSIVATLEYILCIALIQRTCGEYNNHNFGNCKRNLPAQDKMCHVYPRLLLIEEFLC